MEVEWQFDAPDLEAVEGWLRLQPSRALLTLTFEDRFIQRDTYLDTYDWAVYRANFALRIRRSDARSEATLKSLATRAAGPMVREEINQPLPIESIDFAGLPGPVSDRVRLIAGKHPLRTLFEVETERLPCLIEQDGAMLAVLTLDRARVLGQEGDPISRVEIEEAQTGGLKRIQPLIDATVEACRLTLSTFSKFEAGLRAAGLEPHARPDFGPTSLDGGAGAAAYGFAFLRRLLGEFLAHEPGTRLGEEPEDLHDMRVAARRLRSAIKTFKPVLPDSLEEPHAEIGWIGQLLGTVRDLDVQLESLKATQQECTWEEANALVPLIDDLRHSWRAARTHLLEALDSERYESLIDGLSGALKEGPELATDEAEPARSLAERALRRRYRSFRRRGSRLTPDSGAPDFHAVRIEAKHLRYAVESFREIYGRPAEKLIVAVKAAQDLLGEYQDCQVAIRWLTDLGRSRGSSLPPETLLLMGRLLERHRLRSAEIGEKWPKSFDRVRKVWRPLRKSVRRAERAGGEVAGGLEGSSNGTRPFRGRLRALLQRFGRPRSESAAPADKR